MPWSSGAFEGLAHRQSSEDWEESKRSIYLETGEKEKLSNYRCIGFT